MDQMGYSVFKISSKYSTYFLFCFYSLGYPRTSSVDQDGLELLTDPTASASQVGGEDEKVEKQENKEVVKSVYTNTFSRSKPPCFTSN